MLKFCGINSVVQCTDMVSLKACGMYCWDETGSKPDHLTIKLLYIYFGREFTLTVDIYIYIYDHQCVHRQHQRASICFPLAMSLFSLAWWTWTFSWIPLQPRTVPLSLKIEATLGTYCLVQPRILKSHLRSMDLYSSVSISYPFVHWIFLSLTTHCPPRIIDSLTYSGY